MKRVQTIDTEQKGNRRKERGGCQGEGGSQRRTGRTGRSIKRRGEGKDRKRKNRKQGRRFVPYDYEKAYDQALSDLDEWFVEQMLHRGAKSVYALKEIRAGEQFEVEIYPQFRSMEDVPPEGREIKKDNTRAQKNLNDKNARKYLERLINRNFSDRDIWITLTFDDAHLPPDGDIDAAIKIIQKYFRRINYQRRKLGLKNARYVYVIEYSPEAAIRWHYHIVMDGDMDMDLVEKCWKQGSRNEVRRLQKDENGLSGLANYIVKEKHRIKSEKRWNSSRGLIDPDIRVVHSKQPEKGRGNYKKIEKYVNDMVRNQNSIEEQMKKWYPDYDFTNTAVYFNDFNGMFYIHARMRKRRSQEHDERTVGKKQKST
ncbi:hypothetical protein IMSAGC020_00685 [Lachnospiraceae bacterium]|nr:hypothetical protein IMSAGC020_00685 [Lachnospiraceae bacterium]